MAHEFVTVTIHTRIEEYNGEDWLLKTELGHRGRYFSNTTWKTVIESIAGDIAAKDYNVVDYVLEIHDQHKVIDGKPDQVPESSLVTGELGYVLRIQIQPNLDKSDSKPRSGVFGGLFN